MHSSAALGVGLLSCAPAAVAMRVVSDSVAAASVCFIFSLLECLGAPFIKHIFPYVKLVGDGKDGIREITKDALKAAVA